MPDNCPTIFNPSQTDTDTDGTGDACESLAAAPAVGDFVINEVLADPFIDTINFIDANGDGVRDASSQDDEFVELINVAGQLRSLSGCEIRDATGVRHRFTGAVDPSDYDVALKSAVVVFGGGTPTGAFGGATIFVSSTGRLALNNSGDSVVLACFPGGTELIIASMTYGTQGGQNESLTLSTDGDDTSAYIKHTATGATAVVSPGTCSNGTDFPSCLP